MNLKDYEKQTKIISKPKLMYYNFTINYVAKTRIEKEVYFMRLHVLKRFEKIDLFWIRRKLKRFCSFYPIEPLYSIESVEHHTP